MRLLLLVLLVLATGCPHWPVNEPLSRPLRPDEGYRFENLPLGVANTNSVVVCLSFSGGGTRAGAMAYGVLKALTETPIDGGARTLADEIDIISAASGGSFPALYYGAFGPQVFVRDFPEQVLYPDLGMGIFWRAALCPYNLVRISSPWFNRSDLAAELYEDEIYGPWTYEHLAFRGRPYIVLNATDLQAGSRFEFTQDQFDGIGTSLGRVKLARALAASAAFPVLLTPVAFQDHAEEGESYRHLVDGGVVDNMGLGFLIESYERGALRDLIQTGEVETLAFVVVNARTRNSESMNGSPQAPGAASVLGYGLTAAIDRRDEDQVRRLQRLGARGDGPDGGSGPKVHLIEISLEDLQDPRERERLVNVETTFGLEPAISDQLAEASARLLELNPAFRRLRAALR